MDRAERKNAIGFALSGGGLQGIAHIGAIKALYELGIRPQFVSGTSSGAAMAAICAMGMTPEEMRYFAKKHWKTLAEIDSGLIFKALATFIINKKVDKDGIKDGQLIADVVKEGMLLKGVRGFFKRTEGHRARRLVVSIPGACTASVQVKAEEVTLIHNS